MNTEIFSSLLAIGARSTGSGQDIEFFASDFITRLLLFDRYIMDSLSLREIPHLIEIFGYEPTLELIKSDKFYIHHETFVGFGSTAKPKYRPYFFYEINSIEIVADYPNAKKQRSNYLDDQKKFISKRLEIIDDINGITHKQARVLKREIASKIMSFKNRSFMGALRHKCAKDFEIIHPAIKLGIAQLVKARTNMEIDPVKIKLEIDLVSNEKLDLKVNSNLQSDFSLDEEISYNIILRALFGLMHTNLRLLHMKEFNCQIGYKEEEIALLDEQYKFILSKYSEEKLETNLTQVLKVKALPNFEKAIAANQIDLMQLLNICRSQEWLEFRNWLLIQDDINEVELNDRISSFGQKIRDLYDRSSTQVITFLVSQGINAVCPPLGMSLDILDRFVIDKILPKRGAITFINNKLPSIFKI